MQPTLTDRPGTSRRQERIRTGLVIGASLVASALAGLAVGRQPVLALLPAVFAVPVILWRKPYLAIVIALAGATLIEQAPTRVGTHDGAFTSYIPWWQSMTHGMILFPAEIFLLVAILIWILHAGLQRSLGLTKSPVTTALKVFWVFIGFAIVQGLRQGAQLKFDLWEARSWIFLTVGFLLAAALVRSRKAIDAVLWTVVLGTGFKSLQGTVIFFSYARGMRPRPEAILGHEEAFFMGLFMILTGALWLFGRQGALRTTATCFLPFVILTDMTNARRSAWAIIGLGLFVLFGIGLKTLPQRRKFISRALVVLAGVSIFYFPAYWNHTGGNLGQPALALKSQVRPDARDSSSDLYRLQENWNLIANIKADGLLGAGFGIPIQYTGIANISEIDPMIAYIPHNGILWVWLRMGLQGEMAFWCFVAVVLVRASRLARAGDRQLAMLGTVVAAATVGYVTEGYLDMGFAQFRIGLAMGCLIGLVEAGLRLAARHDKSEGAQALVRI